ncbi:MAG: hypothetical protein MRERV_73c001 [Mycoplasmataceae bacterium RV_VA103A]|nr:MAG: hypothetical protein MRERV_73c001 [Mycoplasmataceae bacterium RV_VA103A]
MTNIQEEIKEITSELEMAEKDGRVHKWATIKPKINEISNTQHLCLDTLARLLTGDETCVAIHYSEKEMLIASNSSEPLYAKRFLIFLSKFIETQSGENYEKLIELAIEQIYSRKVSTTIKEKSFKGKVKNFSLENFKKLVKDYESERKKLENKKQIILSLEARNLMFKIQNSAEEVFKEINKLKEEKDQAKEQLKKIKEIDNETKSKYELSSKYNEHNDWEYLLPLQDTNEIVKVIKEKTSEEIIEAIKEKRVKYIEKGEERIHAEMKIINELCKNKQEFEYIGITKLACCPCWTAISIVNPTRKEFCVRGTHGSTYSNWLVPDNIPKQEELLDKLKKLLPYEKVWESTGNLPRSLAKSYFEIYDESRSSEDIIMGELREPSSLNLMDIDTSQQQTQILQQPYGIPGASKK